MREGKAIMSERTWNALIRRQLTRFLTEAHADGKDIYAFIDDQVERYRVEEVTRALVVMYMNHRFGISSSSLVEYHEHLRIARELLCKESGGIDEKRAAAAYAAIGMSYRRVLREVEHSVVPSVASCRATWMDMARELQLLPALQDRGVA